MEQNQVALEDLVKAYISARGCSKAICERRVNLKAPKKPISVTDLPELKEYSVLLTKYKATETALETKHQEVNRQLSQLAQDIIGLIPVKCVWVKVGKLAVSTFYDVWGGGHMELDIRPWADNLPEQTDKTYYA